MRSAIWRDTDNNRAGMLPFAFEDGMGFERYVDYALDVPMYFVKRGDKYIDVSGQSFRDFFAGKLPGLPGERPTVSDWANHVSTIFPEVRLKRYLEKRGSDGGPWRRLPSLTAFWIGLLYDDDSLAAAWDLVKDWTAEERQKLRDEVPKRGFRTEIRNTNIATLAQQTLGMARRALVKRARLDQNRRDETRYLRPLEEIVGRGITPAEEMLEQYFNDWNGSTAPIYDQYAY
jgi:glutamate--cysteine ligase